MRRPSRRRDDYDERRVSVYQLTESAHEIRMWIQNVLIPGAMILATLFATKGNRKDSE